MDFTVQLSSSIEVLADHLRENLETDLQGGKDPFRRPAIVVPNRNLSRWLQLRFAERRGIAANLNFLYLEEALLESLSRIAGPAEAPRLPGPLARQIAILNILAADDFNHPDLEPFFRHIGRGDDSRSEGERELRLFQLSGRLAALLSEYEYHRNDWVSDWLGEESLDLWSPRMNEEEFPAESRELVRAYRRLYRLLHGGPQSGREASGFPGEGGASTLSDFARDCLNRAAKKRFAESPLYVFGISQLSRLHLSLLVRLNAWFPLRLYLLDFLPADLDEPSAVPADRTHPLFAKWGEPALAPLQLLRDLSDVPITWRRHPPAPEDRKSSLLVRLQSDLRTGRRSSAPPVADSSLQIAGCPGPRREIETIQQSIFANLDRDRELRLTDIAILVPDMNLYRPLIESVFEAGIIQSGRRIRLPYNLSDFSGSAESYYAQGALTLLDFIGAQPDRARLFELFLNPCFQSAIGVTREEIRVWLEWVDALNLFHFNGDPTAGQSFEFGVRRILLGTVMDSTGENESRDFRGLLPAGFSTGDDVAGLLLFAEVLTDLGARMRRLQDQPDSAGLNDLFATYLQVPPDRPEEERTRRLLIATLHEIREQTDRASVALGLGFLRQALKEALGGLSYSRGRYLTGGITICSLQPMRPVPFRIVYIPGMGEGCFPGRDERSLLNLRTVTNRPGDLSVTRAARFLFLETLQSVREALYLTYTAHDLARDRVFRPSVIISELTASLGFDPPDPDPSRGGNLFPEIRIPLRLSLVPASDGPDNHADLLSYHSHADLLANYSHADLALGLLTGATAENDRDTSNKPSTDVGQSGMEDLFVAGLREHLPGKGFLSSSEAGEEPALTDDIPTVSIRELAFFLERPLEAVLRRRRRLYDEEDPGSALEKEQPLYSHFPQRSTIPLTTLRTALHDLSLSDRAPDEKAFRRLFDEEYDRRLLRGEMAGGALARIDRETLYAGLFDRYSDLIALLGETDWRESLTLGTSANDSADLPPLRLILRTPEGERREALLTGELEFFYRGSEGCGCIVLTDSSLVQPRHTLRPFLFFTALGALMVDGESFEYPPPFQIRAAMTGRLVEDRIFSPAPDFCRDYLTSLCQEYLFGTPDSLTIELVQRLDRSLKIWRDDSIDDALSGDFRELADTEYGELLAEEEQADLVTLIPPLFPENSLQIARRRWNPFFRRDPGARDRSRARSPDESS